MRDMSAIVGQLEANAEAMRALVETISEEQAQSKPIPDAWSLTQVMGHLYLEERNDFSNHLREMLSDPPLAWGALPREELPAHLTCRAALAGFLSERAALIPWLSALQSSRWDDKIRIAFGPADTISLCAGDALVSWVAHDYLHIRQINELLYAWHAHQASPYSVMYAGGW
jgi:hypothetical protein